MPPANSVSSSGYNSYNANAGMMYAGGGGQAGTAAVGSPAAMTLPGSFHSTPAASSEPQQLQAGSSFPRLGSQQTNGSGVSLYNKPAHSVGSWNQHRPAQQPTPAARSAGVLAASYTPSGPQQSFGRNPNAALGAPNLHGATPHSVNVPAVGGAGASNNNFNRLDPWNTSARSVNIGGLTGDDEPDYCSSCNEWFCAVLLIVNILIVAAIAWARITRSEAEASVSSGATAFSTLTTVTAAAVVTSLLIAGVFIFFLHYCVDCLFATLIFGVVCIVVFTVVLFVMGQFVFGVTFVFLTLLLLW